MHSTCLPFLITLGEGCYFPQVYRGGNGGTERLNNLLKVTLPVNDGVGVQTQPTWLQSWPSSGHWCLESSWSPRSKLGTH